jgi:hypothetical protein
MMVRHRLIGIALRLICVATGVNNPGAVDHRAERNLLGMHRRRHKQRRDKQAQQKAGSAKHQPPVAQKEVAVISK